MAEAVERRRHSRVHLQGQVSGRATVQPEFRVLALSEDGAALEMAVPLPVDTSCELTLNVADLALDVRGRVMNVRQREPGGPYVVGVGFQQPDPIPQALLQAFIERERWRTA
jgi:PilZ domain